MTKNWKFFTQDIYDHHLKAINGIKFTPREIDIISFIISGRSAKKTAAFLSISSKTVENYTHNIMLKLKCNSHENIIDFIEKAGKVTTIKQHYLFLCVQSAFEQKLQQVSSLVIQKSLSYLIIYEKHYDLFIEQLRKYFKCLGIEGIFRIKEEDKSLNDSFQSIDSQSIAHCLFVVSPIQLKQLLIKESIKDVTLPQLLQNPKTITLVSLGEESETEISQEIYETYCVGYIRFENSESYYFSFFDLLKRLFPKVALEKMISEFKEQYETFIHDSSGKLSLAFALEGKELEPKNYSLREKIEKIFISNLKRKWILISSSFSLFIFCTCFIIFNINRNSKNEAIKSSSFSLSSEISTKSPITWNIPKQNIIFVGRKKLLEDLHNKLHQNEKLETANNLAISACAGLGGIGKTQLVLQYIHHTKHPYTLKAWFHAENIDNLRTKYIEFARELGCKEEKITNENAIAYVKKWLTEHPGWLLIYDNVNNYNEIEPFLPEKGGHVILTTRYRRWPLNFKILPIDIMTEEEAIDTIKSLIKRNIEREKNEAKQLVKNLGYLPLALSQAGSYIYQNRMNISEYLKIYKKYEMELLADNTFPEGVNTYPVAVTWNISLEAIVRETKANNESPIAIELLTVCAYLAPEKISHKILFTWLQETHPDLSSPKLVLNRHIGLLWKYSLINNDENHISIHRLVQTVQRYQLEQGLELEDKHIILSTLNLKWYESLLKFFMDNENDFKLSNSFEQLIETRNKFKKKFNYEYTENLAELDLIISPVYFNQEKYDDYLKILDEVNQYLQKKEGLEFLKCKILYLYSAYYRKKHNYEEAEKKLNEALNVFKYIKVNKLSKDKSLKNLKAKILFNKSNLYFAKNKTKRENDRDKSEIKASIEIIKEAIFIFNENHDIRDWLRAIELYGRLLVLTNKGSNVVNLFDKYINLIEEIADDRTKMLFYMTYSDAYLIEKDFKKALDYCNKCKQKAENFGLINELNNIANKEKIIKNSIRTN